VSRTAALLAAGAVVLVASAAAAEPRSTTRDAMTLSVDDATELPSVSAPPPHGVGTLPGPLSTQNAT